MSKFPGLFTNEPGEEELVDDISGEPPGARRGLPPVNTGAFPDSTATEQVGHVRIPGSDRGIPPLDDDLNQTAQRQEGEEPQRKRGRSARERISELVHQRNEVESRNVDLQEELMGLRSQLKEQERRLSSVTRRPAESATTGLYGSGENTSSSRDFEPDSIRQVVEEAIAPLRQELGESRKQRVLEAQQNASLAKAVQSVPELQSDPEFAEAFRELWAGSPLRTHPDGPLHVAYQVRGLFADERASSTEGETRKRAANVVRTGPSPGIPAPSSGGREKMKLYQEALKRQREGRATADDYIVIRKIQRDQNPAFPRR